MDTTERTSHVNEPVTILGRHVRTDPARSAEDIPALWAEVTSAGSSGAGSPHTGVAPCRGVRHRAS